MKAQEKLDLTGHLKITKRFPDGTEIVVFDKQNLITLASRQAVLALLYTYPNLTADAIRYLKAGTGGCVDPQGLVPKQEDETWTDLNTPITTIGASGLLPVSISVDSAAPSVTFLVDIDQSMANGDLITEAGLFKNSLLMFNIKCFPGIPKTSEFSLHFAWTLKFA